MTGLDLTGRIALVTGGAQGLGEGMAQALAAAGARVMIADLQDDARREGRRLAQGRRARLRAPRRDRRGQLGGRDHRHRLRASAVSTSWSTTPGSRSPA